MADHLQSYVMGVPAGNRAAGAPDQHQNQRMRSMSLSNLLRHHKHTAFPQDDSHPPRQAHEMAIDDSEDTHDLPARKRRGRAQSTAGTIKGVIRRASLSLKGMVHRRPSISAEASDSYNQHVSHARPTSAHHTWNRLRHAAPFRRSRSFYGFNAAEDGLYEQQSELNPPMPIPAMGDEPPYIPMNTGAAAKASAALQNEYYHRQAMHTQWLQSSSEDSNDRESGIGIVVTEPFVESGISEDGSMLAQDCNISRIDFIKALPSELAIHILACLDAAALAKASVVSRHWNEVVRNQHIWRESCLREMTTTYATSEPVRPGAGLGVPEVVPTNDWKQIYRAKLELAQKWKEGKARPMYLNGHTDSIYCLQFDEYVFFALTLFVVRPFFSC